MFCFCSCLKLEITFSYSSLAAFRTESVCAAVLNAVVVLVLLILLLSDDDWFPPVLPYSFDDFVDLYPAISSLLILQPFQFSILHPFFFWLHCDILDFSANGTSQYDELGARDQDGPISLFNSLWLPAFTFIWLATPLKK